MNINLSTLVNISMVIFSFSILFDCGGSDVDPDPPPPPNKDVYVEYDWIEGSDLISIFDNTKELTTILNSIYNRSYKTQQYGFQDFRTGIQIQFEYKADDQRLPNPGTDWKVFSNAAANYVHMVRYAQCYKYPNNVAFLSTENPDLSNLVFPFHLLSVKHLKENVDLENAIVAGYTQNKLEGGAVGTPAPREKRWSYIFYNDIITFMESGGGATTTKYCKQNILIYVIAHELGHQIASLTDNPLAFEHPNTQYHGITQILDVMVTRSSRDAFKIPEGTTLVRKNMRFCTLASNDFVGCLEFLKNVTIDKKN